nr:hypothetical protein Iba_chr08dCG7710 [Ipomoea batatas]
MVNPRARGAGEGKGNDDKGKGKMVSPSDTSKDIPLLLKKYELLEESHWKTLLEIDKMVNPRARGAGEGKGNDDKGKGKMVSPSDTSKDIPLLLKKYELLEESHWKTLLEIELRKERS